jgi:predicted RNA polymerase sigma factor
LNHAAEGSIIHEYHIEAAIASVHANAISYETTDWGMILQLYNSLFNRTQNPMVAINRCIVLGEVEGYEEAISELEKIKGFANNCYYNTSLGEMYLKNGNKSEAIKYFQNALELTSSNAEIELIRRKINLCK